MQGPIKETIKKHLELLREGAGKLISNNQKLLQAFQGFLIDNATVVNEEEILFVLKGNEQLPGLLWHCGQCDRWSKSAPSKSAIFALELLYALLKNSSFQIFSRVFWNLELEDFRKLELGRHVLQINGNTQAAFYIIWQIQAALNFHWQTAELEGFVADRNAIDAYKAWQSNQESCLKAPAVPTRLVSKSKASLMQRYF